MARTHVSGILLVIVEVLGAEDAIFIADQPVRGHLRRVEFDLDLDVLGNRHECRTHLFHEDLTGFVQPIDKGDRKSTRLNSSHSQISYAVFCLKKKKTPQRPIARELAPMFSLGARDMTLFTYLATTAEPEAQIIESGGLKVDLLSQRARCQPER